MTRRETVHNVLSQDEKRDTLANDRRANTFLGHTDSGAGGRFAAITESTVTGTARVPQYPRQPEGSPWADEQATEPPLDFDISSAPIVGEFCEVQASLGESSDHTGMNSTSIDSPGGELQRSDAGHSSDVVETGSPHPKQRKRRRP